MVDNTPPVIILIGDNPISINVGEVYIEPGASAIDNVDGNLNVSVTGNVSTSIAGSYILLYTATDAAGNIATEIRTVNVLTVSDTTSTESSGGGSLHWLTLLMVCVARYLRLHGFHRRSISSNT